MKRVIALTALALLAVSLSTPASAYVGPGAGLSLLGAFWALLVAIGTSIAFVVAWPVRKLLRRIKGNQPSAQPRASAEMKRADSA
jgi:hypothetical protein